VSFPFREVVVVTCDQQPNGKVTLNLKLSCGHIFKVTLASIDPSGLATLLQGTLRACRECRPL
jgi:hypothetical protein